MYSHNDSALQLRTKLYVSLFNELIIYQFVFIFQFVAVGKLNRKKLRCKGQQLNLGGEYKSK